MKGVSLRPVSKQLNVNGDTHWATCSSFSQVVMVFS